MSKLDFIQSLKCHSFRKNELYFDEVVVSRANQRPLI